MKTKRVNRYYCDFCKKSGCNKHALEQHEAHCTMNPHRECRMCEAQGESPKPMDELLSILPEPHNGGWVSSEEERKYLLSMRPYTEKLFDKVGGCPACILATFRQKGHQGWIPFEDYTDGFKGACKEFFKCLVRPTVAGARNTATTPSPGKDI